MAARVRLDGLKELDEALAALPKSTGRAVLRRVAIRALAPVISKAKQLVPVDEGALRDSLSISTQLSKRQRRKNAKAVASGKAAVEVYAGATALPHAHLVEFGTATMAAQPFMRPAWEGEKEGVLQMFKDELGGEIEKTRARLARRAARRAAKG